MREYFSYGKMVQVSGQVIAAMFRALTSMRALCGVCMINMR